MKIKILNSNLWILPFPAALENRKRIKKFIEIVKKYDPDIITLQEIWIKKVIKKLARELPKYHIQTAPGKAYNKTGLVTLTKIRPVKKSHYIFPKDKKYSTIEKIAKKGYLSTTLTKEYKSITIVNTHLYNPTKEKERIIPIKQFEKLRKKLRKKDIIISGDLNFHKKQLEKINKKEFIIDKNFKEKTFSKNNTYERKSLVKSPEFAYGTTDNIILKNRQKRKIKNKLIKKEISDHYAIISEITI